MGHQAYTGSSIDKKAVLYVVLGAVSLLLWFLPVALGQPLPYDWTLIVIWLLLMGAMLVSLRHRDRKKRTLMHTVYFDEETHQGFSPFVGSFACNAPQDLIDSLIVLFADMAGKDNHRPNFDAPENFSPSLILETSNFTFRRDEDAKMSSPVHSVNDVTIEEWSGRIVDARTGSHRPFYSLFELEEAF